MANVRVAVRVRPLSKREVKEGGRIIVEIDGKVAKIRNLKVDSRSDGFGDSREKVVAFGFDYCYWSVNPEDPHYASQDVVFQDLGTEVLNGAAKGYNICLFAYGQTGSGKTYTMLGTPASVGLTPRICEGLFVREEECASPPSSCRIKVSFLEIYNERVRDLLKPPDKKKSYTLRVREHPEMGPYVQGLSQHVVTNYKQVIQLLEEGIANRITAATHVHEASSRSHAIFTIHYTQAVLENNHPSEIASKINLVDLAGSERADPSYCKDRITEGANINKSLVTLGIVISTLAQNSQVFSSCQSLNSVIRSGGDSGISGSPGTSIEGGPSRRQSYIPYRDSVLTWLLKDSLGGNSRTIMVATVSPAHTSYSETMSTLRYASNAKNIINKPRVNEDANIKLIRELREEIRRLKAVLLSFELRNFSSLRDEKDGSLKELVLQNELKIDQLTKDWTQKWDEWKALMEHYRVDINRRRAGVVIDSSLPHLMALEEDVLSTGVVLYHLKEGTTKIGRIDSEQEQDIVLQGQWIERDHCTITSACGVVILRPAQGARCLVNGREVTASCRLTQGAVITLGKAQTFRFSHPAEAAVLRQRRQVGEAVGGSGSLEWLNLDGDVTASRLGLCSLLGKKRKVPGEQSDEEQLPGAGGTPQRADIQQQDRRQRILARQIRANQDLELEQAPVSWQIKEDQQWLIKEETWLASLQQQQQDHTAERELEASVPTDSWLQTYPEPQLSPLVRSQRRAVPLQLLQRRTPRVADRNVRRKKASFQLERSIKKRRLLEAQKRLEQLKALYWLQDDGSPEPPHQVPSPDAFPGRQCRSESTNGSFLSLRELCLRCLPQLRSVFLNRDPSSTLPPIPDSTDQTSENTRSEESLSQAAYPPRTGRSSDNVLRSLGEGQLCTARAALARRGGWAPGTCFSMSSTSSSIQERERGRQQPHWVVSQSSASQRQPANMLKPRDEPEALTPSTQARMTKRLSDSGHGPAGWQREGDLETHQAANGASCSCSHPHGLKQAAGHGKAAETFWTESQPPSPNRTSKRQQRMLATRVRGITKKSSRLLRGSPSKRQHSAGSTDTMASLTDAGPGEDPTREKEGDLSDADSSYSVDSLSCVCAKAPKEPVKPGTLPGREWHPPESENTESDNSQISEDSLTEKRNQSPQDSPGDSYLNSDPRASAGASVRSFPTCSDRGLFAQALRSLSLDSLIDAEEELGEDQQEEPFFSSADEMPTETFWRLQTSSLPVVSQEAVCRLGPATQRTGARLDALLPMSSSFYLDSQPLPRCAQPESEVGASTSEQATTLQSMPLSRGSPLLSMDSWFSCDSKINPNSPLGIGDSLCPSPDVQEFQPSGRERPGLRPKMEELKPSGREAVLPYTPRLPTGGAELPCSVRAVYTIPASDTSRLSLWGSYRLFPSGVDGTFQARGVSDPAQQGNAETSNNSSVPSVLPASATSFTYVGSACERDWAALQQKYLLELSHPVLEAIGEPRPAFTSLEEDSGSLTQASSRGGGTVLVVGSGLSSSLKFNNFPIHISKIRHLRAEKEQDSLSVELEGTSDFFTTSEKEVSYSGNYSADIESLTSGATNAQVFAAENKVANSMTGACDIKQSNLEESSPSSSGGKPGLMTSSEECFFLKNPCHSNVTVATKEDPQPQSCAPLRKDSVGLAGQLIHNSHLPPQEEETDCQESATEVVGRHANLPSAFPSGPELFLHSAPWNSCPSALQPPPLETFYVTKSRDALTETALEIPACREARVPSPPPREAWGFGQDYQALQDAYLKSNSPAFLHKQDSKIAAFQQVTAERPVALNTAEVSGEIGKRAGSHNSVYVFVAQNRHFLPSASTKECEYENQLGSLNKHSLPALEGEKTTMQSSCTVSSGSSGFGKPLFVCESQASGEEGQEQNAVLRQSRASDICRQSPLVARSDFTYKTISLGFDKDKSRSAYLRVRSPEVIAQDGSPAHRAEWKDETGLPGKSLHPRDRSEESKRPWTESAQERFQSVLCSQERNLTECKGPGKLQEVLNHKETPSGKKPSKRVNNADEMARLIKSVMQLEDSILEIESKQNKQLYAPHTVGVSHEFVLQDKEMADRILKPGSSRRHLTFRDQLSSPEYTDDTDFRDGDAGEMETSSTPGEDPRDQNVIPSPFKSRDWVQDIKFVREHNSTAVLDRPARDTCDYLGVCITHSECARTFVTPRRRKALARAVPFRPRPEWPSEEDSEVVHASASPRRQPRGSESFEESETMEDFQEGHVPKHISSFYPEEPKIQGRVKEMTMQRGESLHEQYRMVPSTRKLLSPSQRCMGTFFSQETGPSPSQPDSSKAPHRDLSNTLPLSSPRLPRSHLHAPDDIGLSSVDYVLDPTVLKMPTSLWVTEAGCQGQSGEPRSHSPQGDVREASSRTHAACCGSAVFMALGSWGQSGAPETIPLGAEISRRSASTSPQALGGDPRSTSVGLNTRVGSPSEAKVAVQKAERASTLKKRANCPLAESNNQGREVRQKAEKEAEDLGPTGASFSATVSLEPHPEPPAHTSTGFAVLEEIRETRAHGEQFHDLVTEGTVLPYYETVLEPECSSGAPDRPRCQHTGQPVSDRTGNEGGAQGFRVASPSAGPGHLRPDKRNALRTTPLSADSFQPLPNIDVKGPCQSSQVFSPADRALGKSHYSGKLRLFLRADEQFICYSGPFEIMEEKQEAIRISAGPVGPDSLPSSALEEARRVTAGKVDAALSSQEPSKNPGVSEHGQSQSVPWEMAEGMPPGSQESSQARPEPRTVPTTCGGESANFTVAAQGEKTTCFESHLAICNVQDSASLSGPPQDHAQDPKASSGLEEGRARPKRSSVLPGAPRRAEPEVPSQQCVRTGGVGSGLAEARSAGSKHREPAPLPDRRPSPDPGGVREEAMRRCHQETSDCAVLSAGSTEGRETLSPSGGQEGSRTLTCQQPCSPQATASYACSSPFSTSLLHRDGDLGKAAPQTLHPTCKVCCRAHGMDERGESYSREPEVFLTPGPEPKGLGVKFGPPGSSTPEPSAATSAFSRGQGCSSPSAPDMQADSLGPSVAAEDPEEKVAEKAARAELEAAPFPKGACSEPLTEFRDSSVGGQNAQESHTKPELPAPTRRQHALNVSEGSVESELLVDPQHGCSENVVRCLPETPQFPTESRDHRSLDPQARFVAKLKHIPGAQAGSLWEEDKQQREQASGGGKAPARRMNPPQAQDGDFDGFQVSAAGGEEGTAAQASAPKALSPAFTDSASDPVVPVAQSRGRPSSGRQQPAPPHRRALPVIAVFSGPRDSGSPPRPQFSVISSTRSLQQLNLSVEPPSPTDEETQGPNKLWNPHPWGCSLEKSAVGTSLEAASCDQEASSDWNSSSAAHRPLQPASPPYPTPSAAWCMPTPSLTACWMPGTVEPARQGKPQSPGGQARPGRLSEADRGASRFGSRDISPRVLPGPPASPAPIGWKQLGNTADVSCGHSAQGLEPSKTARSSRVDSRPEDQNAPFHSHLGTCANPRGSREAWEVWDCSLALGNHRILTGPGGAAPAKRPGERAQFQAPPGEAGPLRSASPWTEGPVNEVTLLCPSEAGGPGGQSRMSPLEQGAQTLGRRLHWSHTDIPSAHLEASAAPVSDLASWASMHNLSLHLSQLLHSTSELLGSLSQPGVAEKQQNSKRETPGEASQTLTMDGCTQTTENKSIQTELASPPLHLRAPEASPQEVSTVLEALGSDVSTMSQEKGHGPGTVQEREAEGPAWNPARPPALREESTYCRPLSPAAPSSRLRFQEAPLGQSLPSGSPRASPDAALPPGAQPSEPSCLAVSSPSLSLPRSPGPCPGAAEYGGEPRAPKELYPTSALLVDRASSPILALSASTQGSELPLGSLSLSIHSAHPLEGHQELVSSPDLPPNSPQPPMDSYSPATGEAGSSPRERGLCEGRSSSERNEGGPMLEGSSPISPPHSSKPHVRFLEQPPQQLQPQAPAWVQSRLPPLPLRTRSPGPAEDVVPENTAPLECGALCGRGPNTWQSGTENGGESSASAGEPQPAVNDASSGGVGQHLGPCPVSETTDETKLQGSPSGPAEACLPQGLLRPSSQMCMSPEPQHHSLRDLPVHNKFRHWCGVQDGSRGEPGVTGLLGPRHVGSAGEQEQPPSQPLGAQSQDPWSQREQIPLFGAQNPTLSTELTEAKLHRGFGKSDALLEVLQSGTGEALTAREPVLSTWEELHAWQKQTIESLRRQRAERLQNFRRTRSLSPQKQLSSLPNGGLSAGDLDLPSRRREYLQQLRKDVVETTRNPGSAPRSARPPSDIELMLREYQRAREEAKMEIARARDRLREQAEQEKLRIRQQIISQLLREEEKLRTLAASSSLCTSSSGSLSSGVTSGYNSSPALAGQLPSPGSVGDTNLPDSGDSWIGDVQGRSAVRNSHLNLAGSAWKNWAHSRRASLGSCCCSSSSVSSLGSGFSSSYQDLAKHIVDICLADVMAACSADLHNLFNGQVAAGWTSQGEEQQVQLYNKVFTSTRHGFLGAGVVSQPLSHVWAAVSDPTLWPLYHKPIQTARLHQRVTKNIHLVYVVCDPALCALKQPRDFCCVCVEAKEGHLFVMAAQSVYDTSMPRPSKEMVRGEILPSAWILQPLTVEGKEVTRVIYLAQIELGAPGFPPHLLSSCIKQQPLVIARLASFLGS
ncbi:stAR-related lipid transfer protein 9 isoform X2 [Pipistrellus kuhlii]|uniref:StAR-related lipid transfer protein 9 n=1 Tax=Pipistrellus kuhlii TaxID=59472 RepID=A0A7J8B5X5_PIPKU|nr:stAR-related lipid transfer protein 9 isoform X2 [Pipistrellus kuhlii]KAF6393901.1 StAR related lipid transfer domain containing 9 [Pipistrellus kuhlii]